MLTIAANMSREALVAQIYDGLVLMVLGIGTVFVFLVVLIFISKLMSKIVMNMEAKKAPEVSSAPAQPAQVQQKAAPAPQGDDAAVAAAIAAAYDKSKS